MLGAGYCKPKHRKDHFVCAIGYHYAGRGRCVRNGPWWTGRRPVNWGPHYEPRNKSGSITFEGPHGGFRIWLKSQRLKRDLNRFESPLQFDLATVWSFEGDTA